MLFPDQHHIEQIRQRLWCGREFGQAAVMVGAGFSRNADKTSATSPDFPLWWDLEKQMKKDLPSDNISANLDALELASEYEKTFGRQKLEQFLINSIPDKQYNPGKLHELLLSLRWSDVFTTNYDTLLERTFILDRKYDIIYNPSDIPGRMKPRIVKLHGSFESYRPFIFTQQDYESYPRKFAPFVSMVQQSIMENAFILIGFSGEDPNFLKWIEWVRNNLNEYSPPIYLCGLLNISNYQSQILKSRKVTTIDMSPLFPKEKYPNRSLRHSKALEWFLWNLIYGKPPNLLNWLSRNQDKNNIKWEPSEGLPNIPKSLESLSSPGLDSIQSLDFNAFWNNNMLSSESLLFLLNTWKTNRQEYEKLKGWIILPKKNRDRLWQYTENFIRAVFYSLDNLSSPNNLFLLYELNWRLDKTLTPLVFDDWIAKINTVVNTFNPYPQLIDLEASITPDKEEYQQKDWEWEDIQQAWVDLAFALLRTARDHHEKESFNLWLNRLEKIVQHNSEWHSRWFYERCLFHLYRLENDLLFSILEEWELITIPDFWQIKRASIIAQVGNLKEAYRISEQALNTIRSSIQPYVINYNLLSQEGWGMKFMQEIERQIKFNQNNFENSNTYSDRWEELEKYRCNPQAEIEVLELTTDRPPPKPRSAKEEKRGFLPGRISRTFHSNSPDFLSDIHPAFESLRILEEGSIAINLNNVKYHSKHITNAAKWTIPFFPTWSFLSLIQVSKYQEVKEWLSFIDIAILPQKEIDYIYELLYSFFTKLIEQLSNLRKNQIYPNQYLEDRLPVFAEVLSYLCIRLNKEKLEQLFELTISIYKMEAFRKSYCVNSYTNKLFEKLFYTLPQSEIINKISILLDLPIPGENGFEVSHLDCFGEPFKYINWSDDFIIADDFDRFQWSEVISRLINLVTDASPEVRKRAGLRLGKLYAINALTSEQTDLFTQALWSRKDINDFPKDTVYYGFFFLLIPEPTLGIAKEKWSRCQKDDLEHITKLGIGSNINFDKIKNYFFDLCRGTTPLYQNAKLYTQYVDWSSDDAEYFLNHIYTWWTHNKEHIKKINSHKNDLFYNYLKQTMNLVIHSLYRVVLPRLNESSTEIKEIARTLISELDEANISVLSILPITLFIEPDKALDRIARKIRLGLSSLNSEEIDDAILGIENWLICSQQEQIPEPPPDLLNDLVNKIVHQRQPSLNFAINRLANIIRMFPNLLEENQMQSLLIGLEYLLQETELPDDWQEWKFLNQDINSIIKIEDRPKYMRLTASLSLQLYLIFENKEKEIPNILIQWKEASLNSVLPQVRKTWEQYNK